MEITIDLLKMWYDGKTHDDPAVQLRAPIDIFVFIEEINKLQEEIRDARE